MESPDPHAEEAPKDGALARTVARGAGRDRAARRAEALLVERYSRRVVLFGLRHLRREDLAEDLAQEVMARVIERLRAGEVRDPDRIGSFILGTARMMARDERRRDQRRREVGGRLADETDHQVEPTEPLDLDRLSDALQALPERERTVLVLSFHGGRTAREIGESLGIDAGNVRVIRHRALARLQRWMATEEGQP